jgi:hypothetical protein
MTVKKEVILDYFHFWKLFYVLYGAMIACVPCFFFKYVVAQLVEALPYKLEGCGFDS